MANSNKHVNPDLRSMYAAENDLCELAFELSIEFPDPLRDRRRVIVWEDGLLRNRSVRIQGSPPHHIFGGNPRYDLKSNLISIAHRPHQLFHFGHRGECQPIRVLCLLAKARKAERLSDPGEFDLDELNLAAGDRTGNISRCRGRVESATFDPDWSWVEKYREELIDRLRMAEFRRLS